MLSAFLLRGEERKEEERIQTGRRLKQASILGRMITPSGTTYNSEKGKKK